MLLTAVRSLGTDGAAVIPHNMEIAFEGTPATRSNSDLWRGLVEYLDRQVSKLVLGQTLTADTSASGGGAFALGKIHNEIRLDILDDDAQTLARTINRDLIPLLVRLNFAGVEKLPEYTLRVEYPEDLTAKVAIVEKAVAMGYPVPVLWFSDTFGIPMPEDGENILGSGNIKPAGAEGSDSGEAGETGRSAAGRSANGAEKYDAGLINAYSMGVDRLARLGVDIPVSYIRGVFDLPKPRGDEAILVPPVNDVAMQAKTHNQAAMRAKVSSQATAHNQEALDRLAGLQVALHSQQELDDVDVLADAACLAVQETMDGWIEEVESIIDALYAEDPDMPLSKVQEHLIAAYGNLDMDELVEIMNHAVDIALAKGAADQRSGNGKHVGAHGLLDGNINRPQGMR